MGFPHLSAARAKNTKFVLLGCSSLSWGQEETGVLAPAPQGEELWKPSAVLRQPPDHGVGSHPHPRAPLVAKTSQACTDQAGTAHPAAGHRKKKIRKGNKAPISGSSEFLLAAPCCVGTTPCCSAPQGRGCSTHKLTKGGLGGTPGLLCHPPASGAAPKRGDPAPKAPQSTQAGWEPHSKPPGGLRGFGIPALDPNGAQPHGTASLGPAPGPALLLCPPRPFFPGVLLPFELPQPSWSRCKQGKDAGEKGEGWAAG